MSECIACGEKGVLLCSTCIDAAQMRGDLAIICTECQSCGEASITWTSLDATGLGESVKKLEHEVDGTGVVLASRCANCITAAHEQAKKQIEETRSPS